MGCRDLDQHAGSVVKPGGVPFVEDGRPISSSALAKAPRIET